MSLREYNFIQFIANNIKQKPSIIKNEDLNFFYLFHLKLNFWLHIPEIEAENLDFK